MGWLDARGKIARDLIASARVGVVPMTCGQGLIGGFANTVRDIATHIAFDAFVTRHTDVAGMAEAFERKADSLIMADDDRFIALNIKRYRVLSCDIESNVLTINADICNSPLPLQTLQHNSKPLLR